MYCMYVVPFRIMVYTELCYMKTGYFIIVQYRCYYVVYCLTIYVAVSDTGRYAAIADITVSDSVLLY